MFDVLCQIGEVAGILQDIAAREISENKPIAGTAVSMLGRLIAGHVERGMEFTPDRAVIAPDPKPTPKPDAETEVGAAALITGHDYTARADSAWPGGLDLRGLHGALSGVVTCLCALQDMAAGVDLDGDAFEPALATLTPWRDRTLAARDQLEAQA
ncbi:MULTISPECIES: hypothetical protein [Acidiphilium]|nr:MULTISPECIES: hypothetical protein [Acidiphilium]